MEITVSRIVFFILAAIIAFCSVMAVTSRRILRAATYLLFVLLATSGIYLLLNYHFLAAVQISVYVGGILVLFVFSIFLTSQVGTKMPITSLTKKIAGLFISLAGALFCIYVLISNNYPYAPQVTTSEIDMHVIGNSLMGVERFQYMLPFEIISVLLLACIVGSIVIAKKK